MLHLLTEEHRKKVVSEYKKRVTIIFLIGFLVILTISFACLMPTYFMSHGRYQEVLIKKQSLDAQTSVKLDDSSSQSVRDMVSSVEALHIFDSDKSLSAIIGDIVSHKPNGVQVKAVVINPAQDTSVVIDVGGVAQNRSSLVLFSDSLKADPLFTQVSVPLSNFAKEKDITFSMKILVASSTTVVSPGDISSSTVEALSASDVATTTKVSVSSVGSSTVLSTSSTTASKLKK
jgi:hypothetical protein